MRHTADLVRVILQWSRTKDPNGSEVRLGQPTQPQKQPKPTKSTPKPPKQP